MQYKFLESEQHPYGVLVEMPIVREPKEGNYYRGGQYFSDDTWFDWSKFRDDHKSYGQWLSKHIPVSKEFKDTLKEQINDVAELKVKISCCPKCSGVVRAADPNYLNTNTKARNEFTKEVFEYNLSVKEISLTEYKRTKWCECKD